MQSFRVRINWLPTSRAATVAVARAVEAAGLDGIGVCDSPRYLETYSAAEAGLAATRRITVGTNVTNPVTRHWSVHASALRAMREHGPERCYLGMGTGDSALRTHGGRPATLAALEASLGRVREAAGEDVVLNVAAGGPRGAAVAARVADGLVAGVGASPRALSTLLQAAGPPTRRPFDVWASMRAAVGVDDDHVRRLRSALVGRAVSAARFNFGADLDGKDVPDEYRPVLARGFQRYDFAWHGRAGDSPNASLFRDHPEIEQYLVDRFAIVGTGPVVARRVGELADAGFTGVFLSILFEDPLPEMDRLAQALAGSSLVHPVQSAGNPANRS